MKIFYTPLISFLLIATCFQLDAQCTATIKISDDGKGGYTFQADSINNDTSFICYWVMDSLVVDSNSLQDTFKFYTNGNHQICFQYADSGGCSIDTCLNINVEDAEYYPLLDSVNMWTLTGTLCAASPIGGNPYTRSNCYSGESFDYIYTDNDTSINGINYKTVLGGGGGNGCVDGFIREDTTNRKIYLLDINNDPEMLLYDFSLKTGDSIYLNFASGMFLSGYYRLDSIKNVAIYSGLRKAFFLNETNGNTPYPFVWLESVGWLGYPIYSYIYINYDGSCGARCDTVNPYTGVVPYYNSSYVTCFSHAQRVYLDICAYESVIADPNFNVVDSCTYEGIGGAVKNIPYLASFNLSPNPSTGLVTFNMEVAQSSDFEIYVWDLEGKQAVATFPLGKLGTGTYSKQINLSALSAGFYMVECKTSEGSLYRKLVIAK